MPIHMKFTLCLQMFKMNIKRIICVNQQSLNCNESWCINTPNERHLIEFNGNTEYEISQMNECVLMVVVMGGNNRRKDIMDIVPFFSFVLPLSLSLSHFISHNFYCLCNISFHTFTIHDYNLPFYSFDIHEIESKKKK